MEDKAFADAKKANAEIEALGGAKSVEEAQMQRRALAQEAKAQEIAQTQRDELVRQKNEQDRKYTDAVSAYANQKIDPNRLMRSKSDSQKALLIVSAIFGGLAAGHNGGPNEALAAIDHEIDRDIDAQKTDIQNAKEGANLHGNLVANLRSKIGDFDQAVIAAKAVRIEQMKRQMDILASDYKSPEGDARAQAFNAAMNEKLAQLKIQQDNAAKARAVSILDKMPALGGKALNDGTAKGLGEANGAVKTMNDLLGQFNQKASHVGAWLASYLPMTDASKYDQRAKVAAQTIGTYLEGGKLSDANVPMYQNMLPKPGDSKETAQNKRDAIVSAISARQQAEKEALAGAGYNVRGIKDANPQINFTPTGR